MSEREPGVVLATARPDGAHLVLSGDVDGPGAVRLLAQLDDALEPGAQLTLDLSRITRLSVDALGALAAAHRRLRESGGGLLLESLSPQVVRVLRISGLDRVLVVAPTSSTTVPDVDLASGS